MRLRLVRVLLVGAAFLPATQGQWVIPITKEVATGQLGIYVKLGNNPHPFKYILDTGSAGFFSARGTTGYWANVLDGAATGDTFHVAYGTGGLVYSGDVVNNRVTLSNAAGGDLLEVPGARMGFITNEPYAGWNGNIDTMPVPVPPERPGTNLFFGTFGAGLYKTGNTGGDMGSVLGQVPLTAGLKRGFVISTGGNSPGTGTLTVGLTQEMIDSFPIRIAMNPSTGTSTNANGTETKLYPEAQARAGFSITGDGVYSTIANVILDTGGLGTHFTSGDDVDIPANMTEPGPGGAPILKPGLALSMSVDGLPPAQGLNWVIDPTGETLYVDRVSVVAGSGAGSLNTGIALFYEYDVLFDVESGVIGLRPIPEPGAAGLAILAGAGAAALARRRRRG